MLRVRYPSYLVDCSNKEPNSRRDCGQYGISPDECFMKRCCWDPLTKNSSQPWCFYPAQPI